MLPFVGNRDARGDGAMIDWYSFFTTRTEYIVLRVGPDTYCVIDLIILIRIRSWLAGQERSEWSEAKIRKIRRSNSLFDFRGYFLFDFRGASGKVRSSCSRKGEQGSADLFLPLLQSVMKLRSISPGSIPYLEGLFHRYPDATYRPSLLHLWWWVINGLCLYRCHLGPASQTWGLEPEASFPHLPLLLPTQPLQWVFMPVLLSMMPM